MFVHPIVIKNDLHYLSYFFVLKLRNRNYIFIIYQIHSRPLIYHVLAMGHTYIIKKFTVTTFLISGVEFTCE